MKILIISSNLIGDTILSSGIVNFFYEKYPKAKFTFVVGPSAGQIYYNFPAKEKIILVKKKIFNLHWLDIYINVYKIKWDIVIDFRSSLISYFLNKNKKFIFKKKKNMNHVKQLTNFFNIPKFTFSIFTNIDEKNEVSKLINNKYKYIVLFPGGNWEPKIWPVNYFNNLIELLNKEYTSLKFVIVGSKKEKHLYIDKITKNLHDNSFIDLMGKSLTATSAYMNKCNLFIGNDSGLMHLAVASNLKTIALFGPTDDKIYGHNNSNCFIIRTKKNFEDYNRKKMSMSNSYMTSISPKTVFDFINNKKLL